MSKPVYVVDYHTESGDRGVLGYFNREPTEGQLSALFFNLMPDEFIDEEGDTWSGPGTDSALIKRYVFWEVNELYPMKLPKAIEEIESI